LTAYQYLDRLDIRGVQVKTDNRKLSFSKIHVIFADFIVFYVYTISAVLSALDKQPISDVAIAIITVYGAFSTGGYFAQNIALKQSLNKTGVTHGLEGISFPFSIPQQPTQTTGEGESGA
jgi:hypothetical protein